MKEEIKPLNTKQEEFIKSKLLPFAKTKGESKLVISTLEQVLKLKEYDAVDRLIIKFAINELRQHENTQS